MLVSACGGAAVPTTEAAVVAPSDETSSTISGAPSTTAAHDDEADHSEDATTTTETGTVDADLVVDITMDDFSFDPPRLEVEAGQTVLFRVSNVGVVEHEFRLSNSHRIEEHLADGHGDHDDEGDGGHHDEDGDVFILLDPGESGELVVTFPDDSAVYTQIACLIPGHYEAGMVGDLSYANS